MDVSRSKLIVDANVFVHGVTNPGAANIRKRLAEWQSPKFEFHMPSLWRYEVTNAIYRSIKAGLTSVESGRVSREELLALPVEYHDERELHAEATAIALRLNAGAAYDAHYLALARRLDIPFYTADAKLHGPASKLFPNIELVPVE